MDVESFKSEDDIADPDIVLDVTAIGEKSLSSSYYDTIQKPENVVTGDTNRDTSNIAEVEVFEAVEDEKSKGEDTKDESIKTMTEKDAPVCDNLDESIEVANIEIETKVENVDKVNDK